MSVASRLAKADTRIEKPSPRPRDGSGKFLPAAPPPPPEFICPECLHEYWWRDTICTGLWDDERNLIDHRPAHVERIEVRA